MGFIVKNNDKGVHGEARRESFTLFTGYGNQSIELNWSQLEEVEFVLNELKKERDRNG